MGEILNDDRWLAVSLYHLYDRKRAQALREYLEMLQLNAWQKTSRTPNYWTLE